jgi:hypothetical protein
MNGDESRFVSLLKAPHKVILTTNVRTMILGTDDFGHGLTSKVRML